MFKNIYDPSERVQFDYKCDRTKQMDSDATISLIVAKKLFPKQKHSKCIQSRELFCAARCACFIMSECAPVVTHIAYFATFKPSQKQCCLVDTVCCIYVYCMMYIWILYAVYIMSTVCSLLYESRRKSNLAKFFRDFVVSFRTV